MNSLQLLNQIQNEDLLKKIIQQINRDINLVGIDYSMDENSSPINLINNLQNFLKEIMQNRFKDYINIMYRIDISENKLIEIHDSDVDILSQKVTLLVLQKELQKVVFKNKIR